MGGRVAVFRHWLAGAGSLFGERFDEEPCGVGNVVALAVVV
jgi:hypothetical protein